ncbi:TMIG2 protein, partial [Todus mexicanus]|nr:TMIG2 protein [Todus mexicanus]
QEPGEVQVPAGAEVSLGCQVLLAELWEMLWLEWVKEARQGVLCALRLRPSTPALAQPCAPNASHPRLAWRPPRATLSLRPASEDDAGRYLCRVILEI